MRYDMKMYYAMKLSCQVSIECTNYEKPLMEAHTFLLRCYHLIWSTHLLT